MSPEYLTPTDRRVLRFTDFVVRRRWAVIAAALVLVIAAASGAPELAFSNNYRVFFSAENPELVAFEDFQATYTKNDNILLVVQPEDEGVFTPAVAAAIEEITEEAWQIPYAIRVDSVTNFQHSWADGDDLTVEDLLRDSASLPREKLEAQRDVALAEPLLRNRLISPDAATTGVNVTLQFPEKSLDEVPEAANAARRIAAAVEEGHAGVEVAVTGLTMLNNAFAESGQNDAMTLVPFMYLILVVGLVLALRSIAGTIATLLVVFISTLTAMGLAGHIGILLTPISVMGPTIILTLAIADSVHVLISLQHHLREGHDKISALRESLRINFLPIGVTSLSTIVGFLSLNFSDAPPFRDLGNITAMGIAAAWLYSVTFLPAVISLLPFKARRKKAVKNTFFIRFADFVTARHRPLLAITATAAVALIALVPFVDLNDEWVEYFDRRVEFRTDTEFAMDELTGVYTIEYSVDSGAAGSISEPAYLAHLERFTEWLRERDEVLHVYSYTDIIKRLNKNMHGDDPDWYRIPDDRELAAQYLLLYELSLPYGLDLNDRINVDKSATRVTATLENMSTVEVRAFLDESQEWLRGEVPEAMWAKPTGATVMFSFISKRNIESMMRGNLLALVLISMILLVVLRSFGLGLLSLIANAAPIFMTFGLWAILVGQIGMVAATISATALGIVVDDTVHFLSKYLRARREKAFDRPAAVRYAFETVGPALVVTTVVLAVGFAVLSFSTFRINAEMGLMTAIAIVLALVMDFLFLPALLVFGHERDAQPRKATTTDLLKGTRHDENALAPSF